MLTYYAPTPAFKITPWHEFPLTSTLPSTIRMELSVLEDYILDPEVTAVHQEGGQGGFSYRDLIIMGWECHSSVGLAMLGLLYTSRQNVSFLLCKMFDIILLKTWKSFCQHFVLQQQFGTCDYLLSREQLHSCERQAGPMSHSLTYKTREGEGASCSYAILQDEVVHWHGGVWYMRGN